MDKFAELRAFTAVVDAGGFSSAARELDQSRSAVNRLVLALEERLGVQLLHRTTRAVSTTSHGKAFYERARQLLDDLDEAEQAVSLARTDPVGMLRVSVPLSFGDLDFSDLIARFLKRYPLVAVDVSFDSRFVDPVAEGFDVVLRVSLPDEKTTLVDHRVAALDYVLCASPDYLAARAAPKRPVELGGHQILFHRQSGQSMSWILHGPGGIETVTILPRLSANNLEALLVASRAGLGIAIMPEYAIRSDLVTGRLQRVLPTYQLAQRTLQVIYPPARHLSAKVRYFTEFVEEWCTGT